MHQGVEKVFCVSTVDKPHVFEQTMVVTGAVVIVMVSVLVAGCRGLHHVNWIVMRCMSVKGIPCRGRGLLQGWLPFCTLQSLENLDIRAGHQCRRPKYIIHHASRTAVLTYGAYIGKQQ